MREFLGKFRNYLSPQRYVDASRRPYVKLGGEVSLLGYCLMLNHFHLILHQLTADGMNQLMRRATVSYSMYFNRKYGRPGPLFRSNFKATPIETLEHAQFTIAYVHLNEVFEQLDYEFSSHKLYVGEQSCDWVDWQLGLGTFGSVDRYLEHLNRRGPGIVADKLVEMGLPADHVAYRPAR